MTDDGATDWLRGVFDRAAPTYDAVAGSYHEHFGERLVERAGIARGHRVLDVACGRGAALVPAARAAGPAGSVTGGDLSPAMVELARASLAALGIDSDVRVMDAEALDVDDATFDRVLCAFGLFFLPHPIDALRGFRRALVPGGVVGVSTWGAEDPRWAWEDDLFTVEVERRAVVDSFDDASRLGDALAEGGFLDIEISAHTHEVLLADADEWWAWKWSYSLRGILEQLSEDAIAAIRDRATPHLDALTTDRGLPVELTALIATGVVPR